MYKIQGKHFISFTGNNDPNSCRSFLRTPTFAVRLNDHPKYSNAFELADGLQQGQYIFSGLKTLCNVPSLKNGLLCLFNPGFLNKVCNITF